jgi:hypothetical protein
MGDVIGSAISAITPSIKPLKKEILTPTMPGSDVKRMRLTYGPFPVGAATNKSWVGNFLSLDPQGTAWVNILEEFPSDVTILSARTNNTFTDGSLISNGQGVYTHHTFFIDASKSLGTNMECTGTRMPLPAINTLMGSASDSGSAEVTSTTKRPITGNYIAKGHKIIVNGDMVNYNNITKEVLMTADIQYVEGKVKGLLQTSMHFVPVGSCEFKALDSTLGRPPKDKMQWSLKGDGMVMKSSGKMIMVRGHLHGKKTAVKMLGR